MVAPLGLRARLIQFDLNAFVTVLQFSIVLAVGGGLSITTAQRSQIKTPRARSANPQDFYTNRFIDELEQTGFMRELAARYPDALR
jgi:hypothetical protein